MHISRPWQKHIQSFKKISIKLYEELRSQGTHCHNIFIESEVRKWQSSQSGKSNKNKCKDYIQTICTSSDYGENVQSFKKIGIKLYEELRSQGTHCLYIEVEKWLSSQSGKSDKK